MWSKMTLNYHRTMERHPKPDGVVDNSIPGPKIFSPLDKKRLAKGPHATYVPKITKYQRSENM